MVVVKILMLGWELPPHNSGGLGVACFNMARALAGQGADIDFVIPYTAEHEDADFMHIVSATNLDPLFRFGGGPYDSLDIDAKIIPANSHEHNLSIRDVQHSYIDFIQKHFMDFKPDVIHAHDWLTYEAGILAKKHYGVPLIAHVHATEFDRAGMHTGNPLVHEIEREGLMLADKIIAVSESTKRLIHEKYRIPLDKIDVVYNSLDDSYLKSDYEYHDDTYKYITKLKNDGYTVISTVGRFTVQKGLGFLMRAAKKAIVRHPKLLFVFAGDGEEFNDLVALSADLGIADHVIFTGFIRGQKLRDVYSLSDIFVMSSVSEPFGLTALEAAHHGDCLILTKQSGVSEVIWSALEYDFWDEDKLASEIVAIAENPTLRDSLRQDIAEEYRQLSWQDVAKKCLSIYKGTFKRRKP